MAVVVLSMLAAGCGAAKAPTSQVRMIAPCEGRNRTDLMGLQRVYSPAAADSCKVAIAPFDMRAWVEAPLNSHSLRGMKTLVLGCSELTPDAENCSYGGPPGRSTTLQTNFDLAVYPDAARVQKAVLAVYVHNNMAFFAQTGQLRGRLLTGDMLQSLGNPVVPSPTTPGWVLYDITAFVARAINERRNSVALELSLPCGRSEAELVTVGVLSNEPKILVEFK